MSTMLVNPTNSRAQKMWDIIYPTLDTWKGKHVCDFGVGYGDLLSGARMAGALCTARDVDLTAFRIGCDKRGETLNMYSVIETDFDRWTREYTSRPDEPFYDVGFCCSVLPYLNWPKSFLSVLAKECEVTYIECQYRGDGPGDIPNDSSMHRWLNMYWDRAEPIGRTLVTYRAKYRTIWKCSYARYR